MVDFCLVHNGDTVRTFAAEADVSKAVELRALLTAAIRRCGGDVADIGDYELEVSHAGENLTIFVALAG